MISTHPHDLTVEDRYVAIDHLKCQSLDGLSAFPNLESLTLVEQSCTLPTTSNTIPSLKNLTHVTISKISILNIDRLFSELRITAPHLHSLTILDQYVFECFLKQKTWRNIHKINIGIAVIDGKNFIQALADILPDLHFLHLQIVKYDDFQLILCHTLEYSRNLIECKVRFSHAAIDEENHLCNAVSKNLDEWILNYASLEMDTFRSSFDNNDNEFTLWL